MEMEFISQTDSLLQDVGIASEAVHETSAMLESSEQDHVDNSLASEYDVSLMCMHKAQQAITSMEATFTKELAECKVRYNNLLKRYAVTQRSTSGKRDALHMRQMLTACRKEKPAKKK